MEKEQPIIVVNNVDFFYGNFRALISVTMDIMPKQVTALIGPSECGFPTSAWSEEGYKPLLFNGEVDATNDPGVTITFPQIVC